MFRVVNHSVFREQVDRWLTGVRSSMKERVVTMMYEMQAYATALSPVFSGDFASNWNVSSGTPDTRFTTKAIPFSRYEGYEIRTAPWGKGNFDLSDWTLGDTIYLSNSAEHDEPYAFLIENNQINFRPVNKGRDRVAGKTFEFAKRRYSLVGGGIAT